MFLLYAENWLSLMGVSECLTFYEAKDGTFFLFFWLYASHTIT